jgi:hypothetical protein
MIEAYVPVHVGRVTVDGELAVIERDTRVGSGEIGHEFDDLFTSNLILHIQTVREGSAKFDKQERLQT